MRIVMCSDSYWPRVNGVVVSVESFSRALIQAGHQVMVVTSFYPDSEAIKRMASPIMDEPADELDPVVIRVPSNPIPISTEDRLAKFHKLSWVSRQLDLFRPDIVHVNSEFVLGEYGYYYARSNHLPVVYTFHTLWEEYAAHYVPYLPEPVLRFLARRMIRNMANRADAVIAPSPQIMETLRRYKANKPAVLVPTGIDPRVFSTQPDAVGAFRLSLEQKFPQLRNRRILLFAGRVGTEKNVGFLLRMLPLVLAEHSDVALLIAGNGPSLQGLQDEAMQLGILGDCAFTGYLQRTDLALAYALSEIFVFASLTETQGLVTIEAMCSGKPVVAIGAMGTLMVMGGDNGGFMVSNSREEFAARILDLLDDPVLYARKCKEARLHAASWTIDAMTAKLEQIYQGCMESYT